MKIMKKWWVLGLMLCLSAGPAFADVSNEVIVGLEADSSKDVKSSLGNLETDLTDSYKTANAQMTVQYTRFLSPLRDDDTPVELRRFIQHPSSVSIGLGGISQTVEDNRTSGSALEAKGNATVIMLGGEYYFPTDTSLFLSLGSGAGKYEQTLNGVKQPDTDVSLTTYQFGVSQYLGPSARLSLSASGESTKAKQSSTENRSIKSLTLFGGEGVIARLVGLSFKIGGGKRTDQQTGAADQEYDVAQIDLGLSVYAGKSFTFKLGGNAEVDKRTGLPSGSEYTETTAGGRLSATYWFSENLGLQLPVYSKTTEKKTVVGSIEAKMTEINTGIGLYAGFRF